MFYHEFERTIKFFTWTIYLNSVAWFGIQKKLDMHVSGHYDELGGLVKNGITLKVDGVDEMFNVVVFFVADLSFIKEILGRCSCNHTFGCNHCQLPIKKWNQTKLVPGTSSEISNMAEKGMIGEGILGRYPDEDSKIYRILL